MQREQSLDVNAQMKMPVWKLTSWMVFAAKVSALNMLRGSLECQHVQHVMMLMAAWF
jgi:hypothetical protein